MANATTPTAPVVSAPPPTLGTPGPVPVPQVVSTATVSITQPVERSKDGRLTRFGMEQAFKRGGTVLHSTPVVDENGKVVKTGDHVHTEHKLLYSMADAPSVVEMAKADPSLKQSTLSDLASQRAELDKQINDLQGKSPPAGDKKKDEGAE